MTTTRHSTDEGNRLHSRDPLATTGPERVEQLRRAAVYVETAAVLERRAGRAGDPALAALLRERAVVRRRMAHRLRSALEEQASLPPHRPSDREWS
ncbi:hypothetical protein [Geodermatophilus sp. SYSU D00079]